MKKMILILSAAACAVLSACVHKDRTPEEISCKIANSKVHSVHDPENLFTPNTMPKYEKTADGKTMAMITGTIDELPFFTWLVSNDNPRTYQYCFSYTGKDGKQQKTAKQTRKIVPGTNVRFTAPIPAEAVDGLTFHIIYAE